MKVFTEDPIYLVADFMSKFNQPVSQGFDNSEDILLGMSLIAEECIEFCAEAEKYAFQYEGGGNPENFVKELADLAYVVYWMAAKVGIDLDEAIRLVHESNMSKLGEDGRPIYREDGKVMKGPNYHKPDLSGVVRLIPISLRSEKK